MSNFEKNKNRKYNISNYSYKKLREQCSRNHRRLRKLENEDELIKRTANITNLMKNMDVMVDKLKYMSSKEKEMGKKFSELEKKFKAIQDFGVCNICLSGSKNATFIHGTTAHTCCCIMCARQMSKCPICREPIEKIVTNFMV